MPVAKPARQSTNDTDHRPDVDPDGMARDLGVPLTTMERQIRSYVVAPPVPLCHLVLDRLRSALECTEAGRKFLLRKREKMEHRWPPSV